MTGTTALSRVADIDFLADKSEWVATYPRGRVCAHDGCSAILSIYNSADACALHVGEADPEDPVGMKRCSRCRQWWPRDQFRKDRSKPDGLYRMCKACASERDRAAYRADPGRRKRLAEQARKRRASLRRDGRPDAVQRAQKMIVAQTPKGEMRAWLD